MTTQHGRRHAAAAILLVAGWATGIAGNPTPVAAQAPDPLLARIPGEANALVVIDVDAAMASPYGVKQDWKQLHEDAYATRPIILPPEAHRIVLGAKLESDEGFRKDWEIAVMSLREAIPMRSVARSEGGYVDTLAGTPIVWTPSDAYFAGLDEKTLGVLHPANRQQVSRWIQFAKGSRGPVVAPYLSAAAAATTKDAPIVLAIDLLDVPQPHRVREALEEMTSLKLSKTQVPLIAAVIESIKGAVLRVQLAEKPRGTLTVDFGSDPSPLGTAAKAILLATFDRFEMHLGELPNWTVKLVGNSLVAEGPLTDTGLRRIFSLLEIPSTKFSSVDGEEAASGDPKPTARKSKMYYDGVATLLTDLQSTLGENRDNHATWMERFARKVDALPVLNVDDDLLAWGAKVGETFRQMALAERASHIRTGVRKSTVYGNYQYSYDGNGYYSARSTSSIRNQMRNEERAQAKAVRYTSWKELEDETAAVRKKMTQKYQVEF